MPKGLVVAVKGVAFAAAGWFCLRAVVDRDPWVEPRVAVTENPGEIAIDGHVVRGQAWPQPCSDCGGGTGRLEEFDAVFCPACDLWLHHPCELGSTCPYCANRPPRPMAFVRAAPAARARVDEP